MRASIWMNETFTNTSPDGVPPSLKSCKDGSVVRHACIHLYSPSVVPADFGYFNKDSFENIVGLNLAYQKLLLGMDGS